jgi:signal transduction histidine kinase
VPFKEISSIIGPALSEVVAEGSFKRLNSVELAETSYEIDFFPVHRDKGAIDVIVMVMYNITEKMEMEQALEKSDRLASIGQLAAGLAHEINNPMSIILNHLQLIESGDLTEEEKIRYMERMENEIRRVSRLLNNLLQYSREDKSITEHIDPSIIIREMVFLFDPKSTAVKGRVSGGNEHVQIETYRMRFQDKNLEIQLNVPERPLFVDCSRDGFKQILLNVLKNAFQSCGVLNGLVQIHFESAVRQHMIVVEDNGDGIPEAEISKVFDPFFSKCRNGTGLGLFMCRNLLQRMGGSIKIESMAGSGTTVRLFFPVKDETNV